MATNQLYQDHINQVRKASAALLSAVHQLRALSAEAAALDLDSALTTEDFAGGNSYLSAADISAVTSTTLTAIDALLAAGHATNLYKVRAV
jgi:hypothetical protein